MGDLFDPGDPPPPRGHAKRLHTRRTHGPLESYINDQKRIRKVSHASHGTIEMYHMKNKNDKANVQQESDGANLLSSERGRTYADNVPRGYSHADKGLILSGAIDPKQIKRITRLSLCEFEDGDVDEKDGASAISPFTKFDLLATLCSIVFFLYDFISDIVLAEEYYRHGRMTPFVCTACFIAIPAMLSNGQSIKWYWLDYVKEKKYMREKAKKPDQHSNIEVVPTSCCTWFCRIVFTFPLMLGPAVRNVEYMFYGIKSNSNSLTSSKKRYYYKQMLFEDNDASLMRMLEAFLEAAPQLVLQIFIILTEDVHEEELYMQIIRPAAMLGSWVGVSWSLVSYHRALRAMHTEDPSTVKELGMTIIGAVGYFFWRLCEVGPRVVILALFASYFTYWLLIAAFVHWGFMFIWLYFQKTQFYDKELDRFIFNLTIAYILIFCFINVRDGHTRYRAMLYYLVFYVENFVMLLTWSYFTNNKSQWYYFCGIALVTAGFLFQIFLQLIYYRCCHPKRDTIPCCLWPRENYNCFQSMCHKLKKSELEEATHLLDDDSSEDEEEGDGSVFDSRRTVTTTI